MANYKVLVSKSAERSLERVPKEILRKIIKQIENLQKNPYPKGCIKIKGEDHVYRLRQGRYRVIYEILKKERDILILKIGHRGSMYR